MSEERGHTIVFGFLVVDEVEEGDSSAVYDPDMNRDLEKGKLGAVDVYGGVGDGFWACLRTTAPLVALRITEGDAELQWLPIEALTEQMRADFRLCDHLNQKSRGVRYRASPCAEIIVVDTTSKEVVWSNTDEEDEGEDSSERGAAAGDLGAAPRIEERIWAQPYEWQVASEWRWPSAEERP